MAGKKVWETPSADEKPAVGKHPGRQDLRQLLRLGSSRLVPQVERHPGPSPVFEEPRDGRIAIGPVANEDDYARAAQALRTSAD